jgi:S-DNA-T family DNA segregation ATPase FtsK/SpoIIIE
MAEDGIVGEYNGSQAREVQISIAEWESLRSGAENAAGSSKSAPAPVRRNKIKPNEDPSEAGIENEPSFADRAETARAETEFAETDGAETEEYEDYDGGYQEDSIE